MGNGDGTFQSTPVDGPLAPSGWTVTAIAVGDFNQDNLPDIAFTETSPDGTTAQLCVLQNEGGGNFQPGTTLPLSTSRTGRHPDDRFRQRHCGSGCGRLGNRKGGDFRG